jgi:hypothetical protein
MFGEPPHGAAHLGNDAIEPGLRGQRVFNDREIAKTEAPARRHEQLPSRDVFPDAERDDCMTGDVPPALDSLPTSLPHIATPHTRDLDFIKAQIARLPRRTEQ